MTVEAAPANVRPEVWAEGAYRFEAHAARVKLDQNEGPQDLPAPVRQAALALPEEWLRKLAEKQGDELGIVD